MPNFFDKYPYTDFHELNLDWILKTVKQVVADWMQYQQDLNEEWGAVQQDWHDTEEAWTNLKNYVENFFANLNLQQEVNTKIDEMVADGTMDQILLPYFNAYKAEIDAIILAQNGRITVLEGRMDSFAQLAEGSTTGDAELMDARIGANGITYASAGDAIRGQVEDLEYMMTYLSPLTTSGYFVGGNGDLSSNASFCYSAAISIKKGDKISITARGYSTAVGMISVCDSSNAYRYPLVMSIDSTTREYLYTAPMDIYICLCWDTNVDPLIKLYKNVNAANDDIEEILDCDTDPAVISKVKYMVYNNGYTAHNQYAVSAPIHLRQGQAVRAALRCEAVVQAVSECSSDGSTIIRSLIKGKGISSNIYEYIAEADMYICLCTYLSRPDVNDYSAYVYQPDFIRANFSMFEHWGAIGDSFSSGAFMDTASGTLLNHIYKSWPQILARASGNSCINFTKGGLYCGSWLSDADRGLPLLLSSPAQELYIIALGINDVGKLATDQPLGTSADMNADYDLNPYTFYGNYGKIIGNIEDHAPNAKVIMCTIPYTGGSADIINNAIIDIASIKGLPCIRLDQDKFFQSEYFWTNFESGHPYSFVHGEMAKAYERMICNSIKSDVSYWSDTFN